MLSRQVSKQVSSGSLAQVLRHSFWNDNFHTERPNEKGPMQVVFSQKKFPSVAHKYAPWPLPLIWPVVDYAGRICLKVIPRLLVRST